ncbi:MAG: hypothetical protein AAFO69_06550 [Bacteroidota bacterium]
MKNPRQIFHLISYLQYPLVAGALFFYLPFVISVTKGIPEWELLNYTLAVFGVSISFSTLQDTTKVQNKFSKNVWEDPVKGKIFLIVLSGVALLFIISGMVFMFFMEKDGPGTIGVGLLVLGIGLIGMLKAGIEMFENHRKDKNIPEKPSQSR